MSHNTLAETREAQNEVLLNTPGIGATLAKRIILNLLSDGYAIVKVDDEIAAELYAEFTEERAITEEPLDIDDVLEDMIAPEPSGVLTNEW